MNSQEKLAWLEKDYRIAIKKTFDQVEKIYSENDPDILEVEPGLGTITLMNRRAKIILSTQPSVRQLWLAAAHLGKAIHFDYDLQKQQWLDDKEHKTELFQYLEGSVKDLIAKG